jgi:multiple sugar transport system permease protein
MNPAAREFVGLANYIDSLTSDRFLKALGNTVVYIIVAVGAEFIIGLILALLLSHAFKGSQIIRTVLLSPLMLAPLVSGLIWKFMLNDQFGIINWVLYKIGIISDPHQILWLSDSRFALISTIIADIWLTTPFIMLVLLAGIQGISKSLYESADIDGANKWHKFRWHC